MAMRTPRPGLSSGPEFAAHTQKSAAAPPNSGRKMPDKSRRNPSGLWAVTGSVPVLGNRRPLVSERARGTGSCLGPGLLSLMACSFHRLGPALRRRPNCCVRCQQPAYLLKAGLVTPVFFGEAGVPLGLAELAPNPRTVTWFPFPPGATLLTCNCVTGARSSAGVFYPLQERMHAWSDESPRQVPGNLVDDLSRHTARKQRDDITALLVRRAA